MKYGHKRGIPFIVGMAKWARPDGPARQPD